MEFDIEKCQYFDDMPTPFCAIEVLDYERHDLDNYIIRYSNNAHNDLVGLTKEEIEDHSFRKMFQVVNASQTEIYRKTLKNNESRRMDRYNEHLGKFVRVMTYPLAPHICGSMVKVISDYQDNLMGCLNLKGFKLRAEQIMEANPEQAYAFWYCDIKQFKYVNDNFGYEEGDYILQVLGEKITSVLDKDELMGRVTGDIFVLMVKFVSEESSEQRFHHAVKLAIDAYKERWSQHYNLELAGGVYVYRPGEREKRSISRYLDYANSARKQAKRVKGNCVEFFKKEMWEKEKRAIEISHHLKQAIEGGEIQPWFQPQYDYRHGKLIGAEVLTRWVHPEYGNIYPDEFIHVLEESGQILELDAFIWERACQYIRKWQDAGYRMPLSINLSRKDVHGHGLLEQLVELTNKYQIDRELLHLEITESAYMNNPEELIEIVEELTMVGFHVEMDDFGSGYSSLNMLKNVPVQTIKLDWRFVDDLEENSKAGNIISSVVRMAHGLGMRVISEGVETRQQADFLKNLGCDLMQGYCFSKPLPINEFEQKCMTRTGDIAKIENPQMLNKELIQELLQANNNSSFIFNHCVGASAILEYDGSTIQLVLANDKFLELNGGVLDVANVRDKTANRLFSTEGLKQIETCAKQAVKHGEFRTKVFFQTTERWMEIRDILVSQDCVSALLFCQLEDMTQEHILQEELRKEEEKHKWKMQQFQALAHMPGVITYDYNPSTDLLNLGYTNQNGEVREFVAEEFLGKIDQHPWLAPESAQAHKAAYEEAMQRPMTGFVDFMGCFEGEEFYCYRSYYTSVADASGKVYRIVGRADKIDEDVKKIQRLQRKVERDSLNGLLNGSLSETEEDDAADLLNLSADDEYRVITCYLKSENYKNNFTAIQRKVMETVEKAILNFVPKEYIYSNTNRVVYIHKENRKEGKLDLRKKLEEFQKRVHDQLEERGLKFEFLIGIGKKVKGYHNLKESFKGSNAATEYIDLIRKITGDVQKSVVDSSKLGFFNIFSNIKDKKQLRMYIPDAVNEIHQYDIQKNGELVDTLECYLNHKRSIRKTSELMCVHSRTVSYRLQKILELTGMDFDNITEMLAVRNGIIILKILEQP